VWSSGGKGAPRRRKVITVYSSTHPGTNSKRGTPTTCRTKWRKLTLSHVSVGPPDPLDQTLETPFLSSSPPHRLSFHIRFPVSTTKASLHLDYFLPTVSPFDSSSLDLSSRTLFSNAQSVDPSSESPAQPLSNSPLPFEWTSTEN